MRKKPAASLSYLIRTVIFFCISGINLKDRKRFGQLSKINRTIVVAAIILSIFISPVLSSACILWDPYYLAFTILGDEYYMVHFTYFDWTSAALYCPIYDGPATCGINIPDCPTGWDNCGDCVKIWVGDCYYCLDDAPPPSPNPCDPTLVGDPVDASNGMFVYQKDDIGYPAPSMVAMGRVYSSGRTVTGPFGVGTKSGYDHSMFIADILTENHLIYVHPVMGPYVFTSDGTGGYKNAEHPFFKHATAYLNADNTMTLVFKGGSTYSFNAAGRLTEIRDQNGNFVTISREPATGNIMAVSDSFGRGLLVTPGLTNSNLIGKITDSSGNEVVYNYDVNNQLISVILPDDSKTVYAYVSGKIGRILSVTNYAHKDDPAGITEVVNTYDASGRVVSQLHPDSGVFNISYTENYLDRITQTSVTNAKSNTTVYKFNDNGYVTELIDPNSHSTLYERATGTNDLLSVTDPLLRKTSYTYENGLLKTVKDPSGNTTSYVYEDPTVIRPTKIIDALAHITSLTYDTHGNVTEIRLPDITRPLRLTYTNKGLPETLTNALDKTVTLSYDANGMLSSAVDPLGNFAVYDYDNIGRIIKTTDPRGNETQFAYQGMFREITMTDAKNGLTISTFNPEGKQLGVTDPNGHSVSYEYNDRGMVSTMTDQLGRAEYFSYDLNDNPETFTDRKGQTTILTYDNMDRVTRADYHDGSNTVYGYDEVGRLTTVDDSVSGQMTFHYTSTGCDSGCSSLSQDKVAEVITPLGTIEYTYDKLGRRKAMTVAGQPTVNYSYDANGRLTGVNTQINGNPAAFNLGYDDGNRRRTITRQNGTTTIYGYDDADRLLDLQHLDPTNAVLDSLTYTYDPNGNRTLVGRSATPPVNPDNATDISYNQANQMQTFNAMNITSDLNGNMTSFTNSCGTTNYTWDARNRLVGISGFKPDCTPLTASFKYDALGRRIEKTINGTTTQYLYDGLDIIQEKQNGTVTTNYVRTLHIDEPLARVQSDGKVRYYHTDALRSVIGLTNESGQMMTSYAYDPFGNVTITGEASDNPFQYTGRENDGTGLYYYRARYYSPELQRFISEDPIGLMGGINKYVYVGNNPVNFTDPSGLLLGGSGAVIGPPTPSEPPPGSCIGGCHPGNPTTPGYPPTMKLECDGTIFLQCLAETTDREQIEACQTVCESVKNYPPGPARVIAASMCTLCAFGKVGEYSSCAIDFIESCKFEKCDKK